MEKYKKYIYVLPIFVICGVCLLFMKYNLSIKVLGDEFGYWTFAKWLSGTDWSQTASLDAYYSFGYGALLFLIVKLPISAVHKYQMGIIFNIIMLSLVYIIIHKLVLICLNEKASWKSVIVALIPTLYVDNIYYTQFTLAETLLLVLNCYIVYLLFKEVTLNSSKYGIFLVDILSVYIFFVHQRTIGITIVTLGFVIICLLKQHRYKDLIISIILVSTISIFLLYIKNIYKFDFLYSSNGVLASKNDFSGQVSKLQKLLSMDGIKKFVIGVLGKIYYTQEASFCMAFIGIISAIKDVVNGIRCKKINCVTAIKICIVIDYISLVVINTIFMIDYDSRYDCLVYGRYTYISNGLLILIALIFLLDQNEKYKSKILTLVLSVLIYAFCTFVVFISLSEIDGMGNAWLQAPNVYFWGKLLGKKYFASYACVTIISIFMFSILVSYNKKKTLFVLGTALVMCTWIFQYACTYKKGALSWTYEMNKQSIKMSDYITDNINGNIYYYYEGNSLINLITFLLDDKEIHIIKNDGDFNQIKETDAIITYRDSKAEKYLQENGWKIELNCVNCLNLWIKSSDVKIGNFMVGINAVQDNYDIRYDYEYVRGMHAYEEHNKGRWATREVELILKNNRNNSLEIEIYIPDSIQDSIQDSVGTMYLQTYINNEIKNIQQFNKSGIYNIYINNITTNEELLDIKLVTNYSYDITNSKDKRERSYIIRKICYKNN